MFPCPFIVDLDLSKAEDEAVDKKEAEEHDAGKAGAYPSEGKKEATTST